MAINEAQSSIKIMTFVFKTSYSSPNRAEEILQALIAAAARGVKMNGLTSAEIMLSYPGPALSAANP
ncbi:MAG: hypothetical protein HY318_14390 [Armatimonadetes bacterium]|nr:hypothetical protein [Armatimonadota bacterium]